MTLGEFARIVYQAADDSVSSLPEPRRSARWEKMWAWEEWVQRTMFGTPRKPPGFKRSR